MDPSRLFVNLVVSTPSVSAAFYRKVFGMTVSFESDWFVHLASTSEPKLELGLLKNGHEVVPGALKNGNAPGVLLTWVVQDCDVTYARALRQGAEEVQSPRDWFYGQRRAVVRAPDGCLLDLSSPCDADSEWTSRVQKRDDGAFVESQR